MLLAYELVAITEGLADLRGFAGFLFRRVLGMQSPEQSARISGRAGPALPRRGKHPVANCRHAHEAGVLGLSPNRESARPFVEMAQKGAWICHFATLHLEPFALHW
jgi:hypothetical protein